MTNKDLAAEVQRRKRVCNIIFVLRLLNYIIVVSKTNMYRYKEMYDQLAGLMRMCDDLIEKCPSFLTTVNKPDNSPTNAAAVAPSTATTTTTTTTATTATTTTVENTPTSAKARTTSTSTTPVEEGADLEMESEDEVVVAVDSTTSEHEK